MKNDLHNAENSPVGPLSYPYRDMSYPILPDPILSQSYHIISYPIVNLILICPTHRMGKIISPFTLHSLSKAVRLQIDNSKGR